MKTRIAQAFVLMLGTLFAYLIAANWKQPDVAVGALIQMKAICTYDSSKGLTQDCLPPN